MHPLEELLAEPGIDTAGQRDRRELRLAGDVPGRVSSAAPTRQSAPWCITRRPRPGDGTAARPFAQQALRRPHGGSGRQQEHARVAEPRGEPLAQEPLAAGGVIPHREHPDREEHDEINYHGQPRRLPGRIIQDRADKECQHEQRDAGSSQRTAQILQFGITLGGGRIVGPAVQMLADDFAAVGFTALRPPTLSIAASHWACSSECTWQ